MPYQKAKTHFVIVYGGCGTRGPEMTIGVLRGLAFLWDCLWPIIDDATWHWFMTIDPLNYTPHWAKSTWITDLSKHTQMHPQYPESQLLDGQAGTFYRNTKTAATWDKAAVLRDIVALGNRGANNVVVVLVGHGDSKTGSVTLEQINYKCESFAASDFATVAGSCKHMLILLANCHAAKMFEAGVPPNTVAINTVAAAEKEDHLGLMQFLFLVPELLSEQRIAFTSKTVAQFAAGMTEANKAALDHDKTIVELPKYAHFSYSAFHKSGRGPSEDMLFDQISIRKSSGAPIVQYRVGEKDNPITDYFY